MEENLPIEDSLDGSGEVPQVETVIAQPATVYSYPTQQQVGREKKKGMKRLFIPLLILLVLSVIGVVIYITYSMLFSVPSGWHKISDSSTGTSFIFPECKTKDDSAYDAASLPKGTTGHWYVCGKEKGLIYSVKVLKTESAKGTNPNQALTGYVNAFNQAETQETKVNSLPALEYTSKAQIQGIDDIEKGVVIFNSSKGVLLHLSIVGKNYTDDDYNKFVSNSSF